MDTGIVLLSVLYIGWSVLLTLIGVPLLMGWVPPNSLYGFRTKATLENPAIWYAVNRVSGGWLMASAVLTGMVACGSYYAGLTLPALPIANVTPILIGTAAAVLHCNLIIRRMMASQPDPGKNKS